MNIYEQQRDILFEACKKVATAPNCPKWIADFLRTEVMRAKQIKEDFPSLSPDQETPKEDVPLEVGNVVVINNNGQSCVAKLVKEAIPVNGISSLTSVNEASASLEPALFFFFFMI